jgi:hypothetical protein
MRQRHTERNQPDRNDSASKKATHAILLSVREVRETRPIATTPLKSNLRSNRKQQAADQMIPGADHGKRPVMFGLRLQKPGQWFPIRAIVRVAVLLPISIHMP